MINILGTHDDYDTELARVMEDNTNGSRSEQSGLWSKLWNTGFLRSRSKSDKTPKTTLNGYRLAQKDDTTFLTEICAIVVEEPAYQQIVEEIVQQATHSLSIKLKKLEKELVRLVEKEIPRIIRQEIDERVKVEKQDADLAANVQLRSLICQALDAEADHPTNR